MKYLTLILSLICLLSCSQNKKKSEEQQYNEMMNLLKEKAIEQMQTPLDTHYYWQNSPIIEALIRADTTNRNRLDKLKDAYEKSQKMSEAEQDSLIKKFNL